MWDSSWKSRLGMWVEMVLGKLPLYISRSMEKAMKVERFGHRAQGFDVICSCTVF